MFGYLLIGICEFISTAKALQIRIIKNNSGKVPIQKNSYSSFHSGWERFIQIVLAVAEINDSGVSLDLDPPLQTADCMPGLYFFLEISWIMKRFKVKIRCVFFCNVLLGKLQTLIFWLPNITRVNTTKSFAEWLSRFYMGYPSCPKQIATRNGLEPKPFWLWAQSSSRPNLRKISIKVPYMLTNNC